MLSIREHLQTGFSTLVNSLISRAVTGLDQLFTTDYWPGRLTNRLIGLTLIFNVILHINSKLLIDHTCCLYITVMDFVMHKQLSINNNQPPPAPFMTQK